MKHLATTATEWGHSRWETLERCPRAYELRYVKQVTAPAMNNAAAIGIATHRGLAEYYLMMKLGKFSRQSIDRAIDLGPEDVFVKAEAKRLLTAYIAYWEEKERWEVVDVERAVQILIPSRGRIVPFTMRLDLVVRESGRLVLVDHKTAAANRGEFALEHAVNSQFVGSAAAWPYDEPLAFVTLNRIIRTRVPNFDRHSFAITDAQIKEWKRDHIMLDGDRRRYERAGHYPKHRSSCQGRYGLCDYYNVCHGGRQ